MTLPVIDLGSQLEELRETGRCVWLVPLETEDLKLLSEPQYDPLREGWDCLIRSRWKDGEMHDGTGLIRPPHANGDRLAVSEDLVGGARTTRYASDLEELEETDALVANLFWLWHERPGEPSIIEASHPEWPPAAARLFVEVESEPTVDGDSVEPSPTPGPDGPVYGEPYDMWWWRYELGRVEE